MWTSGGFYLSIGAVGKGRPPTALHCTVVKLMAGGIYDSEVIAAFDTCPRFANRVEWPRVGIDKNCPHDLDYERTVAYTWECRKS